MAFTNKFLVCCCILLIAAVSCSYAQLTFTPGWGKRSGSASAGLGGLPSATHQDEQNLSADNCHPTTESLMLIYHLVQLEAQRYMECQQRNEQNNF